MKKALVHLPISLHKDKLELVLAYAKELIEKGFDIHFTSCPGVENGHACISSDTRTRASIIYSCHYCKSRRDIGLDILDCKGKHKEIPSSTEQITKLKAMDLASIKALSYKNINIGYGALSTIASKTRRVNVLESDAQTINSYLLTAEAIVDYFGGVINNYDLVVIFNGRLNDTRPIVEICNKNAIDLDVLELNYNSHGMMLFKNGLPHNIKINERMIFDRQVDIGVEQAMAISKDFFNKRRFGHFTNEKSYVSMQDKDLLPKNWDPNKRNIAIFNSSEDEFISIGGEWDENNIFQDQFSALEFLSNSQLYKKEGVVFYLRVHPNLLHGDSTYLERLNNLNTSNFIVIPADSKVSSYLLLDSCEKVITFGSSMGVEATYWGKPSILIGKSFYVNLDIAYVPKTVHEIDNLITKKIMAKKIESSYLMPPHWLNPGKELKYYSNKDGSATFCGELLSPLSSLVKDLSSKNRRLVVYGAGSFVENMLARHSDFISIIDFIIVSELGEENKSFGFDVLEYKDASSIIKKENHFVLVVSSWYIDICNMLNRDGFEFGKSYMVYF